MSQLLHQSAQGFGRGVSQVAGLKSRGLFWLRLSLAASLLVLSWPGLAEIPANTPQYQPQSGQAGKDVAWVPTPEALVERMLDMAKVTPQDRLIDLGSGDGRTVIAAARRGLRAHGIEYDPDLVALAQRKAAEAGMGDRATFERADLFESDLSTADVITLFLLDSINEKLRPRILDLAPGTRIVSNTFGMGDWEPDETSTVADGCSRWCKALLWIVPAKVAGSWQLGEEVLRLSQRYQTLSGTLGSAAISDARLNGSNITFTVNNVRYAGTVDGETMKGKLIGNPEGSWSASRT